jgi:hypothetical protein
MRRTVTITFFAALAISASLLAQERPGDRPGDQGETAESKKLTGRSAAPSAAQIDSAVTLDAMLKKGQKELSQDKGATIEGYVVQVEKEEDGDVHLVLAGAKGETDTKKWVIVEVTPDGQKNKGMDYDELEKLHGQRVRVTGWLYWEPDSDQPDPRGTRWEIHPVTAISAGK